MKVLFVHGACVLDGQWWWHRTAPLLAERGATSTAALLPSCGEGSVAGQPVASGAGHGLEQDAASVRAALTGSDEPTVVVAHSYGGIVAAQALDGLGAGSGGPVHHLLLISSYLPHVGESLSTFGGPEPAPFLDVDPASATFSVRAEALAETFLQDCLDTADDAEQRLARQSLSVTSAPVQVAGWQQVPTTYLVCGQDLGTPAPRQREFARRAGTVVELDAGHHPFLSQPQAVADLVTSLAVGLP